MLFRYAKKSDLNFLIQSLEENRVFEGRPKKDVKARPEDKKDFLQAIKKKNIRLIEEKGKPIAFIHFKTDFKVMYIREKFVWVDLIFVKKEFRGKSLGKKLYKDVFQIARKKGFKKIVIDVFNHNKKSLAFHTKLGFKQIYGIYAKKI